MSVPLPKYFNDIDAKPKQKHYQPPEFMGHAFIVALAIVILLLFFFAR